ncbi:MAG TPA: biotin/lipoyl-binding protein, partial [Bryobacterales bacterium]|nr:biotin/lipoyl-binding protein [Bryobacterales bacterium]
MRNPFLLLFLMAAAATPAPAADAATVQTELTEVVAKSLEKTTLIPGELASYQRVDIHAKISGFVEAIHVDRGSFVKQGQALAELSAPELAAQRAEAQAKIP